MILFIESCGEHGRNISQQVIHCLFFKRTLLDYFVIAAPNGHGELTFRHAEALEAGRLLVCQDLHHVEMMFPFING